MFYVDKNASASNLPECHRIMNKIVSENPSYWPYGCDPTMFNGGVYMIRKSASHEPVGFTAWQEFNEDGKKVGYYAIGILPEYRNQGFAKEAVSKLINEKSASVDEVRAFIMSHNKPSLQLAKALNVNTLVKNANWFTRLLANKALQNVAGGAATAGGLDYILHGDNYGDISKTRVANTLVNLLGGSLGIKSLRNPATRDWGVKTLLTLPTKDLIIAGLPLTTKATKLIETGEKTLADLPNLLRETALTEASRKPNVINVPPAVTPSGSSSILPALLLGGLTAAGAWGISKAIRAAKSQQNAGRIQLRLPTRDENDQETVVDVPLSEANLPPNLVSKIMRDTRRKLRKETQERTLRRSSKNLPLGSLDEDEDLLEKTAFALHRVKIALNNSIRPISAQPVVNTMAADPAQEQDKPTLENDAQQPDQLQTQKFNELQEKYNDLKNQLESITSKQKINSEVIPTMLTSKIDNVSRQASKLAYSWQDLDDILKGVKENIKKVIPFKQEPKPRVVAPPPTVPMPSTLVPTYAPAPAVAAAPQPAPTPVTSQPTAPLPPVPAPQIAASAPAELATPVPPFNTADMQAVNQRLQEEKDVPNFLNQIPHYFFSPSEEEKQYLFQRPSMLRSGLLALATEPGGGILGGLLNSLAGGIFSKNLGLGPKPSLSTTNIMEKYTPVMES
jgi:hypothetical protein